MRGSSLRCLLGCAVLSYATAGLALDPYYKVTLSGSTAVVKNASGTQVYSSADHQAAIQWAMDKLPTGRTTKAKVLVTGDYSIDSSILFSSYTSLELVGKISLAKGANCIVALDKSDTATETDIEMIGGIYDGNKYNQKYSTTDPDTGYYCIRFKNVKNSTFRDFTAQNMGKDGFILDEECHDNTCSNLVGRWSGYPDKGVYQGNGLGDRGDRNIWTDCLATDNANDSWVIKCRNSIFTRCVARNQASGAAFGLFGDRLIQGNKFYDCEAYNCNGRVLSLRKPFDEAKGDYTINGNYFEIYIHDNGDPSEEDGDQVAARLWSSRDPIDGQELIRDNELHLLIANNYREGLYIQDSNVSGTTGTIVIYSNTVDAIVEGHDNNLMFLVPDMNKETITNDGIHNTVNKRTISRSDTNTSWAARKYYQLIDAATPPSCHIDTPSGNVTRTLGETLQVEVSAFGSDGIERVSIYLNGVEKMSDTSSPYAFSLPLTSSGTFTLTAQVKDVKGNSTVSDNSRTITVQNQQVTMTFYSIGAEDGYVDESSETSNVGGAVRATAATTNAIRVGDTGARKQRKGFVSFDCSSLPDNCTILSATLRLKRGGVNGVPTSLGSLVVDVKNATGGWSGNSALEAADFQGGASESAVATLSYPSSNGSWATGNINSTGLAKITKTSVSRTQYRIRFVTDDDNDTKDDYIGFYSGENATAANCPVLEVIYQ